MLAQQIAHGGFATPLCNAKRTMKGNDVREFQLYGVQMRGRRGELPTRVYDALVKEIVSGRWSIGERLPTYDQLRTDTGLSRTTIEAALVRLDEAGYIDRVDKKGIFLRTQFPGGHVDVGTVGILIDSPAHTPGHAPSSQGTDSFGLFDVATIGMEAKELGITAVPVRLEHDTTQTAAQLRMLQQEPNWYGTLAMVPPHCFSRLRTSCQEPLVYLGVEDLSCSPCVVGNPYQGIVKLTERLIQRGHRRIGMIASPTASHDVGELILRGHRRAMAVAGLDCDESTIRLSTALERLDVSGIKQILATCSCTAYIAGSIDVAQKIAETADLLHLSIPDDLSVVSMQAGYLRPGDSAPVTGLRYNWRRVIETSLDLLLNASKREGLARMVFEPEIEDGPPSSIDHL